MFRLQGSDAQQITRGFSTLADALFPDPAREAQALYYATGARGNAARAEAQERAMAAQRAAREAAERGGTVADMLVPLWEATPDVMRVAPGFGLGVQANRPGMTPRSPEVVQAQIGAQVPYQNTAPGVDEEGARSIQRAHIAAGPGHAAVAETRRGREQSLVTMMVDGVPVPVRNVDVGTPRAPAGAVPIVTQDQVQGNVAMRLAQGQDVPNAPMVLAPGQVTANAGALARDNATPVMVVGPQGLRTVARGERQPGDVIVPNNDPADAAATAALAGAPIDPARVAAAGQAAQVTTPIRTSRAGGTVGTVNMRDARAFEEEIQRQVAAVYGVDAVDPALLSRLTAQATRAYQVTRNAATAIEAVMAPLRQRPPGLSVRGGWLPWQDRTLYEREAPPAGAAGAATPPVAQATGVTPIGRAPDGRLYAR